MAQDQLNYKITADSKGFVNGANQAAAASNRLNKGTKKNSQAFTQLAYAMDDAQYGFRGVQNNIQQIAVQMGAGGPLIIAITAATIAIGYLIDKTDLFGTRVSKLKKKLEDLNKVSLSNDEQTSNVGRSRLRELDLEIQKLEESNEIHSYGGKNAVVSKVKELKLERAITQAVVNRAEENIADLKVLEEKAEALKVFNEELAKIKDDEDIKSFSLNLGLEGLSSEDGLKDAFDINPNNVKIVNADDVLVLEEFNDELDELLTKLGSPLAGLSDEDVAKFIENADAMKLKAQEMGDAVSRSFDQLGSNIANALTQQYGVVGAFLGTIAQALLKYLGEYAAYAVTKASIDSTVAGTSAVAGATTAAAATGPAFPVTLPIFIGAALAAVSAAMSGVGGKRSGSSSSSSRIVGGPQSSSSIGVNSQSDSSNNSGLMAVAKVQGQDLILALQNANYSRAGYNPA